MKKLSVLVMAMMVGSMALATGCNKASDATVPESAPTPATQQDAPTTSQSDAPAAAQSNPTAKDESVTVKASFGVNTSAPAPRYAPVAPPAERYENPGRAPSERHEWIRGHWSWTGRDWLWLGGRWEVRQEGHRHVPSRWTYEHGHYVFVPGHWVRRR
jgi:hypothetical protein